MCVLVLVAKVLRLEAEAPGAGDCVAVLAAPAGRGYRLLAREGGGQERWAAFSSNVAISHVRLLIGSACVTLEVDQC